MGCPDRKRDKLIVAEIERRKKVSSNRQPVYDEIYYEGEITDIITYVSEISRILRLEKIGFKTYLAVLEKNNE
jgi:hypothetical protein